MRNLLIASLLAGMLLCGEAFSFMTGRVDGNNVFYSTGKSYFVDPSFKYIGTFSRQYTNKEVGSLRSADHTENFEIFGRQYNDTNELVEIFIAAWDKLPSRWNYLPKGKLEENYYEFKVTRFTGLLEFLKERGYTTSNEFYGGLVLGYNELNISTKYYLVIANSIFPLGVDKNNYVKEQFGRVIREVK